MKNILKKRRTGSLLWRTKNPGPPRFAWRKSFRTSKCISFHNSSNSGNAILIFCFSARFATAAPNVRRFGLNNATRAFLPAKWSGRNVRPALNTICSSHIITHCKIDACALPFNSNAILARDRICQLISCGRTSAESIQSQSFEMLIEQLLCQVISHF